MMDGFVQSENERIMSNLIRIATVVELDEANARIRVETAGQETGWVPWATGRAGATNRWSAPRPGEQVMLLAPYGDMAQATALIGIYSDRHPAPANDKNIERTVYPDGSLFQHNSSTSEMLFDVNPVGKITLKVGASTIVITRNNVTIKSPRIDLNP